MTDREGCPICGATDTHSHRSAQGEGGTVIREGIVTPDPDSPWGGIESAEQQAAWLLAHGLLIDAESTDIPLIGDLWPLAGPDGMATIYVAGSRETPGGRLWLHFRSTPE